MSKVYLNRPSITKKYISMKTALLCKNCIKSCKKGGTKSLLQFKCSEFSPAPVEYVLYKANGGKLSLRLWIVYTEKRAAKQLKKE